MGKIKNFIEFNEGVVKKFFTGHLNTEEKEKAKEKILSDIQDKANKMVELGHLDQEKLNVKIESLKKKAAEDNWKGKVLIKTSPRGGTFLVYIDGTTGLQNLGSSAYSSVKGNL